MPYRVHRYKQQILRSLFPEKHPPWPVVFEANLLLTTQVVIVVWHGHLAPSIQPALDQIELA